MSINKILADITERGVSLSTRYDIIIGRIGGLPNTKILSFSCEAASFPAKSYMTKDRETHGPMTKLPTAKMFGDVTLTFRCDSQMREKVFFDEWYDLISDRNTHTYNYYDTYVTSINVIQLDGNDKAVYKIELEEAYPIEIGSVELASATNNINKFTVTFTYKEWRTLRAFDPSEFDIVPSTGQIAINEGI